MLKQYVFREVGGVHRVLRYPCKLYTLSVVVPGGGTMPVSSIIYAGGGHL